MNIFTHKREMDKAIGSLGTAQTLGDLSNAYILANSHHDCLRDCEKHGEVVFGMSEETFEENLNHIMNYNLVRIAKGVWEELQSGDVPPAAAKNELIAILSQVKPHSQNQTEIDLLKDLINAL